VIDTWITSYPDALSAEDHNSAPICLSKMPMLLVVKEGHPLLELGAQMTFDDLASFPILPLPSNSFPRFQKVLEQCGLWQNPAMPTDHNWRGRSDVEA